MSGLYVVDMLDVLVAAGCRVGENAITEGWQRRARSSGGFPGPPLGIQWHHTASSAPVANDLSWMIDGSDDAPIGNVLLDRTGTFWPVAAGASNTAGKGGPITLSRGVVAKDSANSTTFAFEVANDGVGELWYDEQIDAYFRGSNALNQHWGNQPDDVVSHAVWAPDRKIDPAIAAAVQGSWRPRSTNSSGTWSLDDIRDECVRRAVVAPTPIPPTPQEDDMRILILEDAGGAAVLLTGHVGTWLDPGRYEAFHRAYSIVDEPAAVSWLANVVMTGALPTGVDRSDVWDQLDVD